MKGMFDTGKYGITIALLAASSLAGERAVANVLFSEPSPEENSIARFVFYKPVTGNSITPDTDNARITIEYFDGLGRKMQDVGVGAAPDGCDITVSVETDIYGNVLKEWNPVPVNGNGAYSGSDAIKSGALSAYSDNSAYTDSKYDNTVNMRLSLSLGQGELWKSGVGVSTGYYRNSGDGSGQFGCTLFTVDSDGALKNEGPCREGLYSVTATEDENHMTVLEFKDYKGRTVLSRKPLDSRFADTYFVYDQRDNLRYMLSPEASNRICRAEGKYDSNDDVIRNYCYVYEYDSRNRLIKKRIPGAEWIFTVYNKYDMVEMTQTGLQRNDNKWTVYQYDLQRRLVFTNEITYDYSVEELWDKFSDYASGCVFRVDNDLSVFGYAQRAENSSRDNIMSVSFYDNYDFTEYAGSRKNDFEYTEKPGFSKRYETDKSISPAQGLQTGGMVKVPDTGTELFKAVYYDNMGRIVQEIEDNLTGGIDKKYYLRNFDGSVAKLLHEHTNGDNVLVSILYVYTYDRMGRLCSTSMSINGDETVTISQISYDIIGRVSETATGGMSTGYLYNVRGWLTGLSSPLMKQTLNYTEHPYRRNPYMNGNINSITTTSYVTRPGSLEHVAEGGGTTIFYYDNLNRLTSAYYEAVGAPSNPALYSTSYNYDLNGNITMLSRQGVNQRLDEDGEAVYAGYGFTDQITATYDGNRLVKAKDYAGEVVYGDAFDFRDGADEDVEYGYDANGNMTSDSNSGITSIEYDTNNLPRSVDMGGARNLYTYDALGRKLRAVYQINPFMAERPDEPARWDSLIYVGPPIELEKGGGGKIRPMSSGSLDDVLDKTKLWKNIYTRDYCGEIIYKDGEIERILTDNGYAVPDSTGGYTYHYYVKDYQGNIMMVVDEANNVVERNDYYPYGMPKHMGDAQPYKYGGKELDRTNGLDLYDFSARWYAPDLPRFLSLDPLTEKYPSISPYAYCAGNPVRYIDPTGKVAVTIDNKFNILNIDYNVKDYDQIIVQNGDNKTYSNTYDTGTIRVAKGNIPITNSNSEKNAKNRNKEQSETYSYISIRGDDSAEEMFEFISNNTSVEIGLSQFGKKGEKGLNYITSSHQETTEAGFADMVLTQFQNGYTFRGYSHSHHNNSRPSGGIGKQPGDIEMVKGLEIIYSPQNINRLYQIYFVPMKKYIPYGKD